MTSFTWSKNIDYDGTYYPRAAKLARGVALIYVQKVPR